MNSISDGCFEPTSRTTSARERTSRSARTRPRHAPSTRPAPVGSCAARRRRTPSPLHPACRLNRAVSSACDWSFAVEVCHASVRWHLRGSCRRSRHLMAVTRSGRTLESIAARIMQDGPIGCPSVLAKDSRKTTSSVPVDQPRRAPLFRGCGPIWRLRPDGFFDRDDFRTNRRGAGTTSEMASGVRPPDEAVEKTVADP
jgi:hypothetical protein